MLTETVIVSEPESNPSSSVEIPDTEGYRLNFFARTRANITQQILDISEIYVSAASPTEFTKMQSLTPAQNYAL